MPSRLIVLGGLELGQVPRLEIGPVPGQVWRRPRGPKRYAGRHHLSSKFVHRQRKSAGFRGAWRVDRCGRTPAHPRVSKGRWAYSEKRCRWHNRFCMPRGNPFAPQWQLPRLLEGAAARGDAGRKAGCSPRTAISQFVEQGRRRFEAHRDVRQASYPAGPGGGAEGCTHIPTDAASGRARRGFGQSSGGRTRPRPSGGCVPPSQCFPDSRVGCAGARRRDLASAT